MSELSCPRCGRDGSGFAGCTHCRQEGVPVNLRLPLADLSGKRLDTFPGGVWGWPDALACSDAPVVTLGEGDTPVVPIAAEGGDLFLKLESLNPTGSHKDRGMAAGVSAAVRYGAETVILPSSGNAGVSAAAYAARAGITCVVTSSEGLLPSFKSQMLAYGAKLAVFEDPALRTRMTGHAVENLGWYPLANFVLPAVGGNPFANEGFKSIAYELARDLPDAQYVVVPTCRADLLSGVHRGYCELEAAGLIPRAPRLVAAETATGAAFVAAMALDERHAQERAEVERRPSPAFSIGSDNATWQGLDALWASSGLALAVDPPTFMAEQAALARGGVLLEASSAVAVAVARRIVAATGSRVVAIATASGVKDSPVPPKDDLDVMTAPSLAQLAQLGLPSVQ